MADGVLGDLLPDLELLDSLWFDPFTKHDLVLGGKTLVGSHRGQTFLVAGTRLRRNFVPLLFAHPLQVIKVSRLTFGSSNLQLPPQISIGLRSGDWLGHSRTLMCFFLSHSFVALALCFGSLSCRNTHPRLIFNALADLMMFTGKLRMGLYMCFLEQGDLAGAAGFQSFTV
ncbi:hypothetical protein QTP86_022290 [Hemibagrus guttatus]|nr:hypothetical protein QTP86_022290 [Hemibagrus guttatus]